MSWIARRFLSRTSEGHSFDFVEGVAPVWDTAKNSGRRKMLIQARGALESFGSERAQESTTRSFFQDPDLLGWVVERNLLHHQLTNELSPKGLRSACLLYPLFWALS